MDALEDLSRQYGLPPIAQLGFVVPDMAAALAVYGPLFGPFHVMDFTNRDCDFRGRSADCSLRVGYGASGDTEVELIEPTGGAGPHREFLDKGGSGLHHVQFRFADMEPWIERMRSHGFRRIWYKRQPAFAVAYLESDSLPLVLEFVEPVARKDWRAVGKLMEG
jgi:methylmalonyl-CoA/ethylmalonyl-CoA epimerase